MACYIYLQFVIITDMYYYFIRYSNFKHFYNSFSTTHFNNSSTFLNRTVLLFSFLYEYYRYLGVFIEELSLCFFRVKLLLLTLSPKGAYNLQNLLKLVRRNMFHGACL